LHPTRAERSDEQVRLEVEGELLRCSDFEPIWRGRAKGRWPTTDPKLTELSSSYASEIGPGVRPWVPATFRLLRALLDSLPRPAILGEDLLLEKIELGE
jgi:probable lipoprotein (TIGR04455 family)